MPYSLTSSKCIHQISHEGNSWWWWPNLKIQTKITHYSNSAAFEFVTPLTNRYFWNQEIILAQLKEIHSIIITVNLFTAQVVQISPKLLTQFTNMFSQIWMVHNFWGSYYTKDIPESHSWPTIWYDNQLIWCWGCFVLTLQNRTQVWVIYCILYVWRSGKVFFWPGWERCGSANGGLNKEARDASASRKFRIKFA